MAKKKDIVNKQATMLAQMTFKLEKMCQAKENYFAQQFELTAAQFRCLRYIKDQKNLSVGELASNMNLTPSRITHLITSLEKKDLIIREMDKNDRRNIQVKLTKKAQPFVKKLDDMYVQLHESIINNMKNTKRTVVLDSLEEMFSAMNQWSEENIDNKKKKSNKK